VIEGLKIDVSSEELAGHLRERHEFHAAKARSYGEQLKGLHALKADEPEANFSNDPSRSLGQSADQHRKKSAFFLFLAEHLVPDETYRLQERDLEQLELYSRYG
jgi:hypothetical protein